MKQIGTIKIDGGLKILTKVYRSEGVETETWVDAIEYFKSTVLICADIPGVGKYNWTMAELEQMNESFKKTAETVRKMLEERIR